jgi:hypothetical protein
MKLVMLLLLLLLLLLMMTMMMMMMMMTMKIYTPTVVTKVQNCTCAKAPHRKDIRRVQTKVSLIFILGIPCRINWSGLFHSVAI